MSVIERPVPAPPAVDVTVDERAARRTLRDQIARLERELVLVATSAYPRLPLPRGTAVRAAAGPRVLTLGELERTRDDLAARVQELRATRAHLAERQAAARLLVERMLLDPGHHRWVRVTNDDLGEPGCKTYAVRPRLGLVGMLAGWWHVKVSSGCPLATGPRRAPRPRPADMGRRSRKRPDAPRRPTVAAAPPERAARPAQSTARRRPGQSRMDRFIERADERPKPPWHPVPLVELAVLVGIVAIVVGLLNAETSRGRIAMVFGLALASLAGLDTAAREHFAGFRSHSSLLAGMPTVAAVAALGFAGVPVPVLGAVAALVFGLGFWALRNAFRRRAGVAFKV